ncbi:MAG: FKBP-type peptidyl-prolyl cis-trans isomerase [Candidatus Jordarchaeum sp.]|uniref:FKBP-type peptidyl-prolyl cis-trans isomerase n=1 Tax=Candidatus Jordarchaeum sp. TaxID=2823881 RepID=UPI00404B9E84
MPIKKGDKVKVEYTGKLDDGTIFDSSEGRQPLEFEVGSGRIIKGFDQAVMGMERGEEKEFSIEPNDAYGDHDPDLLKKIPRDKLPAEAEVGMMLMLKTPEGVQIPAEITEITDADVTIDLNHPLAGQTLNFKIKIVDIS